MKKFPKKNWIAGRLDDLLGRIDQTGEVTRRKGSGCKKEEQKEENIAVIEKLILSQEG